VPPTRAAVKLNTSAVAVIGSLPCRSGLEVKMTRQFKE
jgi:hypothetical protein